MKKEYSKPKILFESFEFTTSIASGCAIVVEKNEDGVYTDNEWPLPYTDNETCGYNEVGPEYCYHVPVPGNNYFSS